MHILQGLNCHPEPDPPLLPEVSLVRELQRRPWIRNESVRTIPRVEACAQSLSSIVRAWQSVLQPAGRLTGFLTLNREDILFVYARGLLIISHLEFATLVFQLFQYAQNGERVTCTLKMLKKMLTVCSPSAFLVILTILPSAGDTTRLFPSGIWRSGLRKKKQVNAAATKNGMDKYKRCNRMNTIPTTVIGITNL